MKYLPAIPGTARRITAVIAAASAAGLIAATAMSSPGAVLTSGTARTTATAVPSCTASDLGAWVAVSQGDGAAGSIFYPLQFTNLSRHACVLRGFPGVSAVDRGGRQLGSPAGWNHARPVRTVMLAAGATAHAILRYGDVAVATAPRCHPVSSMLELRVYPPGQRQATYAAFSVAACSHTGPVYLDVTPVQAGVGTRNS